MGKHLKDKCWKTSSKSTIAFCSEHRPCNLVKARKKKKKISRCRAISTPVRWLTLASCPFRLFSHVQVQEGMCRRLLPPAACGRRFCISPPHLLHLVQPGYCTPDAPLEWECIWINSIIRWMLCLLRNGCIEDFGGLFQEAVYIMLFWIHTVK